MNHRTGIDLTVQSNEILISYNDLGTGKMPVIFIHGFPFDKSSWNPQMEQFSKQHRVIAYDIRGFGKSGAGTTMFSISLFARDLIDFMNIMQIEKAIVCGLSMGGYILLNAINVDPSRFGGVILCDTQCIADTPEIKSARNETIELIRGGGKSAFTDGFIKKLFCESTPDTKPEVVRSVRETIMNTADTSITGTLSALAGRTEMCSILPKVRIPTLILCGESDVITPLEQSRLMKNRIPKANLRIIKNAGHLSNLEQPEDFNEHVSQFLFSLTE